jgi:hypothetical protein
MFNVLVDVPVQENDCIVGLLLKALKSKVPVNKPIAIEVTLGSYPVPTVTVPPPEEPSKVTVSLLPGTEAPLAPPLVADQCVVSAAFHVPVPPTQKREAIVYKIKPTLKFSTNE